VHRLGTLSARHKTVTGRRRKNEGVNKVDARHEEEKGSEKQML
jgi:hypothetical protein